MEGHVDVAPDVRLWFQDRGDRDSSPLLLVMGANASGLIWPSGFLASLAEHHHVIRYDHRDTGRSTWAFDQRPYALADLAGDAVAVLDALGVEPTSSACPWAARSSSCFCSTTPNGC
jgi:pimeloyl-ACP methyl ester carboxylesterase